MDGVGDQRVVALDGPGIEVGKRFEIKQPRLPKLVWEVTEVDPGGSWTWRQRSPGGTTVASHEVVPKAGDARWCASASTSGARSAHCVGVLMRRLTRRYLELEAQGLKARSEQPAAGMPRPPDERRRRNCSTR